MSGKNVLDDREAGWAVAPRGSAVVSQTEVSTSTATGSATTCLAVGSSLKGELSLVGESELNGNCDGEIVSEGQLTIGESAEINGDITGSDVRVFGRVAGDIVCSSRLELHAGAHVTGSITSPRVVMHDGVVFEGDCKMPEGQQSIAQPATRKEIVNE